jgi:uncharacterized protein (TIGR00156 family)
MYRKILVFLTCLIVTTTALAGFQGPGAKPQSVTAKAVNQLKDDVQVTLVGKLERQIGSENYIFRDDSGTVEVEIDKKVFKNHTVTPKNQIRITGEVDKGRNATTVEVKQLEVLK